MVFLDYSVRAIVVEWYARFAVHMHIPILKDWNYGRVHMQNSCFTQYFLRKVVYNKALIYISVGLSSLVRYRADTTKVTPLIQRTLLKDNSFVAS